MSFHTHHYQPNEMEPGYLVCAIPHGHDNYLRFEVLSQAEITTILHEIAVGFFHAHPQVTASCFEYRHTLRDGYQVILRCSITPFDYAIYENLYEPPSLN